nr:ATP-binding protein [uncultured Undibacterium sp.]
MSASDNVMAESLLRIKKIARRHPHTAVTLLKRLELDAIASKQAACKIDALMLRYFIQERLGEAHHLIDDLNNASFLAEANDLPNHAGKVMVALGRVYYALGKYRDAANFWSRSIDLSRFTKDIESLVESRIGLGQIYNAMGDHETGMRFHRDAGGILRHIDNPYLNAKQAINLAANFLQIGQKDDAKGLFVYAMDEASRGQIDEYFAEALWHLGAIDFSDGQLSHAKESVNEALAVAKRCGYKWLFGAANDTLAKIALKEGNVDSAIETYLTALVSAKEMGSLPQLANFYHALSDLYESKNQYQLALQYSRLHQECAIQLSQLIAVDKFQDLRDYDISSKAPPELLLELDGNPILANCTFTEALRIISNKALEILRIEYVCVWLKNEESRQLVCNTISGPNPLPFLENSAIDFDYCMDYYLELSNAKNPLVVHDVRLHPAASDLLELARGIDMKSLLELPIRKENEIIGVLSFGQCKKQRNWSREDILYASHICNLVIRAMNTAKFTEDQKLLAQKVEERTHEVIEQSKRLETAYSELLYKDKALRDHASQNQTILDNLVDGVITIDAIGTMRSFNLAAMGIFGYTLPEVIGQNIRMLMPEPDRSRHDTYLHRYNTTGEARIIGIGREVHGKRKDGSIFPMELAVSKSSEFDETVFIGMVRDVTERRRLEKLKSEFISTVSHELRTPLTSIQGSLSLLENGVAGKLSDPAHKLVELASRNSQRLTLLINDLLDIEKLAAGKMALNLTSIDIVNVVKQSIRDNGGYGLKFNVQYVLGSHPERLNIIADGGRLAQVLANLLSNAAKFSGESHQVDVRIIKSDVKVMVEIEDHGYGIPADFQKEIFNSFAQANNGDTRQQGGTGLGLKISKSLIEAMNGHIGFQTKLGSGTIFWFTLPIPLDL